MGLEHTVHAGPKTEIIIPTLAEGHRAGQLMRAIDSIQSQGGIPLVVVNGPRFDPSLKQRLESLQGIRLICVAEPGLPNAIHVGRTAVRCEYFGFLDDDDYLLAGSISLRESFLEAHPRVDAVIANGLREEWRGHPRLFKGEADVERIIRDPLAALLEANWMTPCGPLYRTSTAPPDLFLNLTKYAEWTDVAFRLMDKHTFEFMLENTFVQTDSPASLSKQKGQAPFVLALHMRMSGSLKTRAHRRLWARRICALHHQIADDELAVGHRSEAFRHHLRSMLRAPSIGLPSYLAYTRKFLLPNQTRSTS